MLLILVSVMLTSCNEIDKLLGRKPYVEVNEGEITVSGFKWSYGTIRVNELSGDFDKLDKKVFNRLKGKEGKISLYIENTTTNSYGRTDSKTEYIGDIDLNELNRYQGWEYWHKTSGIRPLLKEKFKINNEPVDKEDALAEETNWDEIDAANPDLKPADDLVPRTGLKPLSISQEELYPSSKIRAIQDSIGYIYVEGLITQIDTENGILTVEGNDGKRYDLILEVNALPESTLNKLSKVLVPGTGILSSATLFRSKSIITQVRFSPW